MPGHSRKGYVGAAALIGVSALVALTGGASSPWLALFAPAIFIIAWYWGPGPGLSFSTALFLFLLVRDVIMDPPSAPGSLRSALFAAAITGIAGPVGSLRWLRPVALRRRQMENLRWNEALADITQSICFSEDLQTAVDLVVIGLDSVAAAPSKAVLLYEQSRGELRPASRSGLPEEFSQKAVLQLAQSEVGRHLSENGSLVCVDVQKSLIGPVFPVDTEARSFALVPLISLEGMVGALYLSWREPDRLGNEALTRLEQFADSIAFALQRIRNEKEFERLALTDGLTGLYNYRMLQTRIAEESARAMRHHDPLSLLMLDLDHFKSVNDQHGHPVGDQVLRALAQGMRDQCRTGDVPARYGGEEFAILCPGMSMESASAAAERIRRSVHEAIERVTGLHLTVSIGAACYPETTLDPDRLLEQADQALYQAKRAGRNRIHPAPLLQPDASAVEL